MHVGTGPKVHRPKGTGGDQHMHVGAGLGAESAGGDSYMHVRADPDAQRPSEMYSAVA